MQQPTDIKNVRIAELDTLTKEEVEQYAMYMKFLKPIPKLGKYNAPNLYELEFAEVTNIKAAIDSGNHFEAMVIYYKIPMVFLMKKRLIEYSHALNYMTKEVKILVDREIKTLSREPDAKRVAAGIRELDRFGPLNVLDMLGKQFSKSPTEIEKWSYGLVFSLLWKRAIEDDINESLSEMSKK